MDNIKAKIIRKDLWYIENQIACSTSRPQRKIIKQRFEYILNTIHVLGVKNPIMLDAGCGDGVNLRILTNVENATVLGIDFNPLRLSRARNNCLDASVICGSLTSSCFKENTFDFILLNHVLEHIEEDIRVLKELHRNLKPNGIFICGVPNEGCFIAQLRNRVIERNISRTTDHKHFYTEKEIKRKLESCGWEIKNIRRENFFMPHQVLNSLMARYDAGFKILKLFGNLWTSQCGGLHFVCGKSNRRV